MTSRVYTETEVLMLVECDDGDGYGSPHSILTGELTPPLLQEPVTKESYDKWFDTLYKAGIDDCVRKAKKGGGRGRTRTRKR